MYATTVNHKRCEGVIQLTKTQSELFGDLKPVV